VRNNKQGNKYNKKTFNRKAGHLHEIILLPKQNKKNWRETDAYAQSRLITAVTAMVEICLAHAQTKCPSAHQLKITEAAVETCLVNLELLSVCFFQDHLEISIIRNIEEF